MTTDLEAELRTALHTEATAAPVVTPEWPGPTIVAPAAARHHGRVLAIAAVLVLAVGAAGAVLALRRSASPAPGVHTRPSFLQGTEITIEPTDPVANALAGQVVKPGSLRSYRVGGTDTPITVYDSALNDGYFRQDRCIVLPGATACLGLPQGGAFFTVAGDSHVGWVGLPTDAAYVQFVAADGTATWQVPIDGNAVLPVSADDADRTPRSLVAFDVDGTVVKSESFDAGAAAADAQPPFVPGIDDHPDRALELVDVGRAALNGCLARISARPLPDAAWDACVDQGAAAMLARNEELSATP